MEVGAFDGAAELRPQLAVNELHRRAVPVHGNRALRRVVCGDAQCRAEKEEKLSKQDLNMKGTVCVRCGALRWSPGEQEAKPTEKNPEVTRRTQHAGKRRVSRGGPGPHAGGVAGGGITGRPGRQWGLCRGRCIRSRARSPAAASAVSLRTRREHERWPRVDGISGDNTACHRLSLAPAALRQRVPTNALRGVARCADHVR